ncbi:hypothetical protein INR49_024280 [Caranx melampygus]|nr:hypothetical protein INR49_024280 [Caranx melampygus]
MCHSIRQHSICCSDMTHPVVLILMLNIFCAFSQIPHEVMYVVGCFVNGTTEVQFEFDSEELLYVDFQTEEIVYTVPTFLDPDPDPPDTVLYAAEDVQEGVENSLICFVNHFYPPAIEVTWTKNGHLISEGVSLSRFHPNNDQTFHQFSTLTFTPKEGDIYSCTVEHSALGRPTARFWAEVKPYVRLRSVETEGGKHPAMLRCSVYNFYPKRIKVTWLRDGKTVTSDMTSTDELSNGNWLYQIHSYLEYTPRPGERITCMVEHASLKEPELHDWGERVTGARTTG